MSSDPPGDTIRPGGPVATPPPQAGPSRRVPIAEPPLSLASSALRLSDAGNGPSVKPFLHPPEDDFPPTKVRAKPTSLRLAPALGADGDWLDAKDAGEEVGAVVSRKKKKKATLQHASSERTDGRRDEGEGEDGDGDQEAVEGVNGLAIAAAEELAIVDDLWNEEEMEWSRNLREASEFV